MPYVGRAPSAVPVTADDIPANSIDASKIVDGSIELAEIADNSITDAKLNSSKLDGIATSANNYTHPATHATADIADNAITEAKIADAAVVSLKSGRKNLIINGGFDVWQRGTSFSSNKYTADRWYQWNGTANTTVTQSAIGARITSTSFSGANLLEHRLEGTYTAGKTVTLSVKTGSVCSNAGAMIYTRTTGGSWQYTVISGGLVANTVNTFTGTVPADAGKINIRLANVGSGALDLDVEYAQLEVGSVATDFEHRSYGEELALCQRYYQKHLAWEQNFSKGLDANYDGHVHGSGVSISGVMRTTPSVSIANKFRWDAGTGDWTSDSSAFGAGAASNSQTYITGIWGRNSTNAVKGDWSLDAEL